MIEIAVSLVAVHSKVLIGDSVHSRVNSIHLLIQVSQRRASKESQTECMLSRHQSLPMILYLFDDALQITHQNLIAVYCNLYNNFRAVKLLGKNSIRYGTVLLNPSTAI